MEAPDEAANYLPFQLVKSCGRNCLAIEFQDALPPNANEKAIRRPGNADLAEGLPMEKCLFGTGAEVLNFELTAGPLSTAAGCRSWGNHC